MAKNDITYLSPVDVELQQKTNTVDLKKWVLSI